MKQNYKVLRARLTWDEFEVMADTPTEAARLVSRGKVQEKRTDIPYEHDSFYDTEGTVTVISPYEKDSAGFQRTIAVFEDGGF